jgi:hypothetical protein
MPISHRLISVPSTTPQRSRFYVAAFEVDMFEGGGSAVLALTPVASMAQLLTRGVVDGRLSRRAQLWLNRRSGEVLALPTPHPVLATANAIAPEVGYGFLVPAQPGAPKPATREEILAQFDGDAEMFQAAMDTFKLTLARMGRTSPIYWGRWFEWAQAQERVAAAPTP